MAKQTLLKTDMATHDMTVKVYMLIHKHTQRKINLIKYRRCKTKTQLDTKTVNYRHRNSPPPPQKKKKPQKRKQKQQQKKTHQKNKKHGAT